MVASRKQGERAGLRPDDVRVIRALARRRRLRHDVIGELFNITGGTVSDYVGGVLTVWGEFSRSATETTRATRR